MRYSRIAVRLFEREGEDVFYDPVYHGRTLKVFGMDDYPLRFLDYIVGEYRKLGYSAVVFDTTGKFPKEGFDTVISIEDGKGMGLDPIRMAAGGYFDPYTAATIVQTLYGLDRTLTDRLYSDILCGKIKSVPEAARAGEKYSEVILEGYTALDEAFYSGETPNLGKSVLISMGSTYDSTIVGMAFLTLAAALEKRRETVVGIFDGAVLGYTTAGGAALPLLTKPLRRRVTIVATQYAVDSILNLPGSALLLYHDPDVQGLIYESNGVSPGPSRRFVAKGEGAFIVHTPETVEVLHGRLPEVKG